VRSDDGRAPTNEKKVTFVGNGTKSQRLFVSATRERPSANFYFIFSRSMRSSSSYVAPRLPLVVRRSFCSRTWCARTC
jgi:hypothetical protein